VFYAHLKQKNAHFTASLWGKILSTPLKKPYKSDAFKERKWLKIWVFFAAASRPFHFDLP